MSKTYKYVRKARKNRKQLLIDYLGGKCARCGYHICIEALDFHHIDPIQKDFSISQKWATFDRCIEEVKKCILLCANCHRELEYNIWDLNEVNIPKPDEEVLIQYYQDKQSGFIIQCPYCKIDFRSVHSKKKYCSNQCKRMAYRKAIRPELDVLQDQVKQYGFVGTGRLYNVSDNAIRKWMGIKK